MKFDWDSVKFDMKAGGQTFVKVSKKRFKKNPSNKEMEEYVRAGDLRLITIEEDFIGLTDWGVEMTPPCVEFYGKLVRRFGAGSLVSYQAIAANFKEYNYGHHWGLLKPLWFAGWVEKYAAGMWGLAFKRSWRGINDVRGRYHGVHYKLVKEI